jgi:hypothetical protein
MQNYTALTVKENEPISLLPDSDIVNSIIAAAPDLEMKWSHNGIFLEDEENRLEIKNYEIGDTILIINYYVQYIMIFSPD